MGRYRDHRQRDQGFVAESHSEDSGPSYFDRRPARSTPMSGTTSPVEAAEVLWFKADKGFGFVRLSDGSDAFLHISKLQAAGHDWLPEGAALQVRIEPGPKGPQVAEIISASVEDRRATPQSATRSNAGSAPASDQQEHDGTGIVKRYDSSKGFGFIEMDGGGKDVFVHATALARSGLVDLDIGQKLVVRYIQTSKGLEARSIRLLS